jgi:hypothetical protein
MSPPLSELSPDQQCSPPTATESFEQYYDTYSTLVVPTGPVPDFYTSENLYLWQDMDGIYHWADAPAARSDSCLGYPASSYYASAFAPEAIQPVCSHCRISPLHTKASPNSLTTVVTDTVILRSHRNPRLVPRTTRTSFTWPSSSGMVRAAHRSGTVIGRALHAQATTSSHKGLLFLATGTRPRDVEVLWNTSHPSHINLAFSVTFVHRRGNVLGKH